ncbi:MAG: hypothetical protein J2P50_12295 [Hyphomicrobiaceae bacterium]|nr:hypothetical protein [Hyphomicrobiaceae bacterium]
MRRSTCAAWLAAAVALGRSASSLIAGSAAALEEDKGEKQKLEACAKDLCSILVKREANGADLTCALQKTWAGAKVKEGVEQKKLTWGFGDVRCAVDVVGKRRDMIDALTKPEYEYKLPIHTVRCDIEREKEVMKVTVSLSPKLQFKDGKLTRAWLGIGTIEAPSVVKGAIWTAVQLEDTFGIVHGDLLREVNKFVYERCPKQLEK